MSNPYWSQWSHSELMSIQGIEIDDYHHEDEDSDLNEEDQEEIYCCSRGCMDCLGLSWRDFM
jgi:hypothetical protein